MIFVILGSQEFQFNRLLKKIDTLIEENKITDDVFAQIGSSNYIPKKYKYANFINRDQFRDMIKGSELIITHGGTGSIVSALKAGKKVIAVPRLEQYGEHVDNHQIQILKEFDNLNLICACYDVEKLDKCIAETTMKQYDVYKSNTDVIINDIENYLFKDT